MEAGSKVVQYHQTGSRLSIFFMLYICRSSVESVHGRPEPEMLLTLTAHAHRRLLYSCIYVVSIQDMLCGDCIEQELWLIEHLYLCYRGKILYQETLSLQH